MCPHRVLTVCPNTGGGGQGRRRPHVVAVSSLKALRSHPEERREGVVRSCLTLGSGGNVNEPISDSYNDDDHDKSLWD